jgi:hypothetical protein
VTGGAVLARGRTLPDFPDPAWLKDFELQYIELEEVREEFETFIFSKMLTARPRARRFRLYEIF